MTDAAATVGPRLEQPTAPAPHPPTDAGAEPMATRLFWAAVVAALLPIAVAVVRALRRGWLPVGDDALFLIRGRDVLTEHHPLLGTWTSASLESGTHFNHPGPMIFDLLALPTKLWGPGGLAVGTAALNGLAVLGVGLVARRRGGPVVGVAALLVTSLLAWTMGSELLYDPWNPHVVLLPFLFLLTCTWSLADGDHLTLPWAVASSSFIVQTHLSYVVLGTAAALWGVVGLALDLRRRRADDPGRWPHHRRSVLKVLAVSVAVLGACWIQPVIETFTAGGQGNLERLARNGPTAERTVGVELGTRIVADTVAVPPFWLRPSFEDALLHDLGVEVLPSVSPSLPVAAALLAALAAALAALARHALRRRDRTVTTAAVTALVVLTVGLVTSWRLPLGGFFVAAHQFRWLWPASAFTTLVFAVAAIRWREGTRDRRPTRAAVGVLTGLTVVVAAATLPTHSVRSGPVADAAAIPTLRAASGQMGALAGRGPLLVDLSGTRFAEPYSTPVVAELQRRGIPFTVDDEVLVRQLGESRRDDGRARWRLRLREGDAARAGIPGAFRAVYVEGLTAAEQRQRDELRAAVIDHLVTSGVTLRDPDDPTLGAAYRDAVPTGVRPDRAAVANLVDGGTLKVLVDRDLLVSDPAWSDRLARLADLQHRWERHTLGLFLSPIDPAPGAGGQGGGR